MAPAIWDSRLDVKTPNGSAQGATQHQGFSASPRCFCRSLASTPFGQTRKRSCASLASGDVTTTADTARITTVMIMISNQQHSSFFKGMGHESRKFGLSHMIITYHPSFCILSPQDEFFTAFCPSRSRPLAPVWPQDSGRDPRLGAAGWRVEALDTGQPTKVGTVTLLMEEILHHLECINLVHNGIDGINHKLPTNCCRISSINSSSYVYKLGYDQHEFLVLENIGNGWNLICWPREYHTCPENDGDVRFTV